MDQKGRGGERPTSTPEIRKANRQIQGVMAYWKRDSQWKII